jgi:hypothetical protein
MREAVTLRAIVPRRLPSRVRGAFVTGAGEQLREQDGEDEIARGVGMGAAAGRGADGEEQERAEIARGAARSARDAGPRRRGLHQPCVAPGM